jgi:rfaE bifunctional protein nucleotidyltransferase chain/domain
MLPYSGAPIFNTVEAAAFCRASDRAWGRKVVATNGCYDLLHYGHVRFLEAARRLGDVLIVLVNSDASVRTLKGPGRPLVPEGDRAYLLSRLRCVGGVLIFSGTDCAAELCRLAPDVYAKDEAWRTVQHPAEKAALEKCGTEVVWLPRTEGVSTTDLAERMGK